MKSSEYYHSKIEVIDEKFPKHSITLDQYNLLVPIIKQFNKSTSKEEKTNLAKSFPIPNIFPICRICGNIIVNHNWSLILTKTDIRIGKPEVYKRTIDGNDYFLSCCEDCLLEHFKDCPPASTKYYYMKANKYGMYSFGYTEDEYRKITSMTVGVTKESMIRKHGEEEGLKRWQQYCDKQAETNTFEYKQKMYGWNKEQFDEFNRSRACTIETLTSRYGEEEGLKRWQHYLNLQHETKSWDYMVDKYGEEKAKEINLSKAITLPAMIERYGEEEGTTRYNDWYEATKLNIKNYSDESQELFNKIKNILGDTKYTYYYATNGGEYQLHIKNKYCLLDFYIPELSLCIEFDGDVFHANPQKYNEDDIPAKWISKATAKEIWERDKIRQQRIESCGIKVIRIWESEYNSGNFNIKKFITEKLGIEIL